MSNVSAAENFELFVHQIQKCLSKEQIISDITRRFAYGTDASFYRLTPKLVLRINSPEELTHVIIAAKKFNIAITFRAAGTSLSGQAITDSVLIILSSDWQGIKVFSQGDKISLQPGVIGASANAALQPFSRKIGPDPASINSCKIGGIAANNASGMCCGVKQNSYHTLASMKIILANGTRLDTNCEASVEDFLSTETKLVNGLQNLAKTLKENPVLLDKIKHKYRLKNTTGYGVNALIDFENPVDIISHLMIGSEGTLGFIENITYNTIKVEPYKATGLYIFSSMRVACELVSLLSKEQVQAVELMDSRALNCVNKTDNKNKQQGYESNSAGLLIEFSAKSKNDLDDIESRLLNVIKRFDSHLQHSEPFTCDKNHIDELWRIRKGLFPAVGANRTKGTTVVIEDVALPLSQLADGVADLQQLFTTFNYNEAIIFGHALDGNLHFVFTQSFDEEKEVKRYESFMSSVSELVAIKYQGSLKAEHGTGRNMAPFVSLEWGEDIYHVMEQIKHLFDPTGILNPGVIINNDKNIHLKHLKKMPQADEVIDECIECGFCEPVCPSKNFTLTPRQRIAVWRQIQYLEQLKSKDQLSSVSLQNELKALKREYQFLGVDSCAATGLCAQACPVNIDTGKFIKGLRATQQTEQTKKWGRFVDRHFATTLGVARGGLNVVATMHNIIGEKATQKLFSGLNKLSYGFVPKWHSFWPHGANTISVKQVDVSIFDKNTSDKSISDISTAINIEQHNLSTQEKVIYIPACPNRLFSSSQPIKSTQQTSPDEPNAKQKSVNTKSLIDVMQSLMAKANIELIIPNKIESLCCGMPWASKGLTQSSIDKKSAFIAFIDNVSEQGKWPVITDASPCALTLSESENSNTKQSVIYEATEYIAKVVLDKITITPSDEPFMLHKSCSSIKMDEGKYLEKIARLCSANIIVPEDIKCCGFAGDKGFYLPALNESALQTLRSQVPEKCTQGLSNSKTCEIGLSHHSGINYQSILYLLDDVSQKKCV